MAEERYWQALARVLAGGTAIAKPLVAGRMEGPGTPCGLLPRSRHAPVPPWAAAAASPCHTLALLGFHGHPGKAGAPHPLLQLIPSPSSTAPLHSADPCPACTHRAGPQQ